ncbi:MAG: DUF4339 domain-containing protein [Prosthecobacter sp.]|nr:DUF4339 domain-containing protein [Prosthecobacter sp.]
MYQEFYIKKGGKTLGPCSLDDLRTYLAYGSARESDLVRREGDHAWIPLRDLPEFQEQGIEDLTSEITSRRRVARYRDYMKVPPAQRSGIVRGRIILGFLFFPPLLWKAAATVFQENIYTPETDEHGFLKSWPRWVSSLLYPLLILNAVLWLLLIWTVFHSAAPLLHDIIQVFRSGTGTAVP